MWWTGKDRDGGRCTHSCNRYLKRTGNIFIIRTWNLGGYCWAPRVLIREKIINPGGLITNFIQNVKIRGPQWQCLKIQSFSCNWVLNTLKSRLGNFMQKQKNSRKSSFLTSSKSLMHNRKKAGLRLKNGDICIYTLENIEHPDSLDIWACRWGQLHHVKG